MPILKARISPGLKHLTHSFLRINDLPKRFDEDLGLTQALAMRCLDLMDDNFCQYPRPLGCRLRLPNYLITHASNVVSSTRNRGHPYRVPPTGYIAQLEEHSRQTEPATANPIACLDLTHPQILLHCLCRDSPGRNVKYSQQWCQQPV